MPAVLLMLATAPAGAFESQWLFGLDVGIEKLAGKTAMNGVPLQVQRATGPDVPLLADRMRSDWRDAAGEQVLASRQADWNLFSRVHGGQSEVVQWRGAGAQSELLWSIVTLRDVRGPPPVVSISLPQGCQWLSPIHGSVEKAHFIQTTGFCPREVAAVAAQLRRSLSREGWRLHEPSAHVLQVERGNRRAQIVLAPASQTPTSAQATHVVIVEVGAGTNPS